ncbi:MAG: (d)CMP kinase [Deltaproteobacteria bacterium]|nr:(d)CMP kinase [Deltaproteobacteria bacterium]
MTVITIDGPAGSGKSTVSRLLAERLGYVYLDTGAMYRAVALVAKENDISVDDEAEMGRLCRFIDLSFNLDQDPPRLFYNGADISKRIRTPEIDMLASNVSAVKTVRYEMRRLQRQIAKDIDVVAEGRDMGTEVFPSAMYKFFLTASIDVRSKRRYAERLNRGETVSLEDVKKEMEKRDSQDQMRAVAPLRPAEDAKIIDSSLLTPDKVIEEMIRYIDAADPI